MDVEFPAEVLAPHGGALAVPSGKTVTPGRGPPHDVLGLRLLPEGEVGPVVFLAYAGQRAAFVLDVLEGATAQDAVLILFIVRLDVEVDGAVRLVGKAIVENLANQLLLFDDVARGMRFDAWRQHVESLHGLVVAARVVLGNLHGFELLQSSMDI